MRNSIFAAAALSASMLSACDYDSQSDGVETPGAEVSNPVEGEMQETGESLRDAADNAAEEIEAASEEAENAVNDAGESMTESTDIPQ